MQDATLPLFLLIILYVGEPAGSRFSVCEIYIWTVDVFAS